MKQDDGTWTTGTIISDQSVTVLSFAEDNDGELFIIDDNSEVYYMPCGDACEETEIPPEVDDETEIPPEVDDETEIPPEVDDDSVSYTYLGCYGDNSDRIFSGNFLLQYAEMTTEFCFGFCQGSAYFGTQYNRECWCGEATDDPTILGSVTCTRTCFGDASQICGGRWAMSVYEYEFITL
ncbi:unnamed protein product [Ascophyllum nodosum]